MWKCLIVAGAFFVTVPYVAFCQGATYNMMVMQASDLYDAGRYEASGIAYSKAFAANHGLALYDDRYNAACSWALAGNRDSAIHYLQLASNREQLRNYKHMLGDSDLRKLHEDKEWTAICEQVKQNLERAERGQNKELVARLKSVHEDDQKYRRQVDSVEERYGRDAPEAKAVWAKMRLQDSLNELIVIDIIEKHGWPSPTLVGDIGANAVFLVVQHARPEIQQKYLPLMREAVARGEARPSSIALLEDRVALGLGKKQIYGSQVVFGAKGPYVATLEDPDHVDERRASMRLWPLAGYLKGFGLDWDVEAYKRQLPELEKDMSAGSSGN